MSISLTNLFAQLVPLDYAFTISSLGIFFAGILFSNRSHHFNFPWIDFQAWPQLLWLGGLTVIFELIQRGVAIFDEYLHLPLVSILAAGDIPPHFPVNPTMEFAYHYGIQLWAATLVRIASFTPWAAFDTAKALSLAFTLVLAWLWVRRWTRRGTLAGLGSLLIGFGGGALWLLLLLPHGATLVLTSTTHLVNAAADTAPTLMTAMTSPWVLEGGGPFPFPFAYVNGVFMPLIFQYGSSAAFPFLIMTWILLIASRARVSWTGSIVLGLVLATLALVAEHIFALLWLGMAFVIFLRLIEKKPRRLVEVGPWLVVLGFSAFLGAGQGGYISVVLSNLWHSIQGISIRSAYTEQFGFRWPPGIFSQKLGVLSIFDPRQIIILLIEIGPVILVAPLVAYLTFRWIQHRNYLLAGLGIASFLCLLFPLIVEYSVDPSTTRFSGTGLWLWLILSIPGLVYWLQHARGFAQTFLGIGAFITVFSGLVIFAVMLIAIQAPQFTSYVQAVDVEVSTLYWNKLPAGAQVLDRDPSRSVTLFGREIQTNQSMYTYLPSYVALQKAPDPFVALKAGFSYIYMDRVWWNGLSPDTQALYKQPCMHLLGEWNGPHGDFRQLYDISRCQ